MIYLTAENDAISLSLLPRFMQTEWVVNVTNSSAGGNEGGREGECRASDFPFQKKQFSVSKKGKIRFDSVSLLAKLNSIKSQ